MNENDDAQTGANNANSLPPSLSFEQTIQHLTAGYQNSQNAVRFLDTKAAAVVGGVPVFLGICAAVIKWMHDAGVICIGEHAGLLEFLIAIASLVVLYFALLSLGAAFTALLPNNTGFAKPSVLFPYPDKEFRTRLDLFVLGANEADAIEDYERQIMRMSEIVKIKLTAVHKSIRMAKGLLAAAVISGLMLIVTSFIVDSDSQRHVQCVDNGNNTILCAPPCHNHPNREQLTRD